MTMSYESDAVPVLRPDLTPEELIREAQDLREWLLDEQAATEERGTYSPELHEKFKEAGFYRIVQPRHFGGYEFDAPTFSRVCMEVARGCPSTAWCLALGAGHALALASHWEESAQAWGFGPDGHFIAPHRGAPGGNCEPVDGGYMVSGQWGYCSGVPYSTHFMGVTSIAPRGEGELSGLTVFLVAREDFEVQGDWGGYQTLGLNGSGSHSVEVKETFVPEDRMIPFDWLSFEDTEDRPGPRIHGNPMYLGRPFTFNFGEIVGVIVGAARGALDESEQLMRTRRTPLPPFGPRLYDSEFQRQFGHALGLVESAEHLLLASQQEYMASCRRWADGGGFTLADDGRSCALAIQAGALAEQAMDITFSIAGSSEARAGSRMLRFYRDLKMQRTQLGGAHANLDQYGQALARAYLFGVSPFDWKEIEVPENAAV